MKVNEVASIVLKHIAWMVLDLEEKTYLSDGTKVAIQERIEATKWLLERLDLFDEAKLAVYIEFAREKRLKRAKQKAAAA